MCGMPLSSEISYLPKHFTIHPELRMQLGARPGHQRCMEGGDELLLVLHDVPQPARPEREALFFWKRRDGGWSDAGGERGLVGVEELLWRYERAIDSHEEVIDEADTAAEIFAILRHAGPLARSSRNLVAAMESTLECDEDDKNVRNLRDRSREVERAAELLYTDARATLEFWRAEQAEQYARSTARLSRIAFRLNLLTGFFLPFVAIGGVLGMNVKLPAFLNHGFWWIVGLASIAGVILLVAVGRNTGRRADFGNELEQPFDS